MPPEGSEAEAAHTLARAGVPVFPCEHDGPRRKAPLVRQGFKAASSDVATVRGWWKRWPRALVGVPTGRTIGLVVVDLDPPHGEASWADLAGVEATEHPKLSRTPSGGAHLWFRITSTTSVPCSAGKLGQGIDVRGDGGYVILPPSEGYTWGAEGRAPRLPGWLAVLAAAPTEPAPRPPASGRTISPHRWAQAALDAELEAVRCARPGQRNEVLNRASYKIGQIVAGGKLDYGSALSDLVAAAAEAGLSSAEANQTARSGLRAGGRQPRG